MLPFSINDFANSDLAKIIAHKYRRR